MNIKINWALVLNISCVVLGIVNIILAILFGHWWNWLIGGWVIGWGVTNLLRDI